MNPKFVFLSKINFFYQISYIFLFKFNFLYTLFNSNYKLSHVLKPNKLILFLNYTVFLNKKNSKQNQKSYLTYVI